MSKSREDGQLGTENMTDFKSSRDENDIFTNGQIKEAWTIYWVYL